MEGPPLHIFPYQSQVHQTHGVPSVKKCKGQCAVHYMKPLEAWKYVQEHGNTAVHVEPPSALIQNAVNQAMKSGTDILGDTEQKAHLAKKTNFTVKETAMWLKHQIKKSTRSEKSSSNENSKQR